MDAPELSPQEHLELVKASANELATRLRAASDAGVSPALILPQLMLIFRSSFGAPPPELLSMLAGSPVPVIGGNDVYAEPDEGKLG